LDTAVQVEAAETVRVERIETIPYAFYRLRFRGWAAEQGYWAVFPFDADGNEMRADTHSTVYASEDWLDHETCFRGLPGAVAVELGFRGQTSSMDIEDIEVEPVDTAWVLQWADALYATVPPIAFEPAAGRHRLIPKTMERLRSGETVRVLMLGDSISQDTCNSYYDLLVERMYPGADLQLVPSIDGSKGCWYYLNDDLFQNHVVDQKPELLMVGTASEHHGIKPVEQFLERVRVELDCEVMVVSGPMGDDFRVPDDDMSEAACRARDHVAPRRAFAAEQKELCAHLGVEYLDLSNAWLDYLAASGKPHNWFHRDAGHANDRGKQVLARFMEQYFAPTTTREWPRSESYSTSG
jgi:hypothetical protein